MVNVHRVKLHCSHVSCFLTLDCTITGRVKSSRSCLFLRVMYVLFEHRKCKKKPVGLQLAVVIIEVVTEDRYSYCCRAQWLRCRSLDAGLRKSGYDICAAVLKPWNIVFTLHCSSSLSCINEYMAIHSGLFVFDQSSRINCSIWLDASNRSCGSV